MTNYNTYFVKIESMLEVGLIRGGFSLRFGSEMK